MRMKFAKNCNDVSLFFVLCLFNAVAGLLLQRYQPTVEPPRAPSRLAISCAEGETVQRSVHLENHTNSSWIVRQLRASCGCVRPTIGHVVIPPKSSLPIDIEFDSDGWPGENTKRIWLDYSFPSTVSQSIELRCQVSPTVEISSKEVLLSSTQTSAIVTYRGPGYKFLRWANTGEWIRVNTTDQRIELSWRPSRQAPEFTDVELFFDGPHKIRRKIRCLLKQ